MAKRSKDVVSNFLNELAQSEQASSFEFKLDEGRNVMVVMDRSAAEEQAFNEMCREWLPFFAHHVLKLQTSTHHDAWTEMINQIIDDAGQPHNTRGVGCILAPRDHGKSVWFVYALSIWLSTMVYPGDYGAIVGEGDVAWRRLKEIKTGTPNGDVPGIRRTPALKHLETGRREDWCKDYIKLSNGSEIFAKGAKAAWRGTHPKWLICDDILPQSALFSPTERRHVEENLFGALIQMIKGGPVFVVGTPLHERDLYDRLKKTKGYRFNRYPCIQKDKKTGNESALWPERYSLRQLHTEREQTHPLIWSREKMCLPITSMSSLFPDTLFQGDVMDESYRLGMPLDWVKQACPAGRFIGMDIGISANVSADWTVIWVIGVDDFGNRRLLEVVRAQGMGFTGMIDKFIETGIRYDVDLGVIESVQAQAFVVTEAIKRCPFAVKPYRTGSEKHELHVGIPSLRILFENSKYRLPRGDERSIELTNLFIHELQGMTIDDGRIKSVTDHDDTVMACWLSEQAVRMTSYGGMVFDPEAAEAGAYDRLPEEQDAIFGDDDEFEAEELGFSKQQDKKQRMGIPTVDEVMSERLWEKYSR